MPTVCDLERIENKDKLLDCFFLVLFCYFSTRLDWVLIKDEFPAGNRRLKPECSDADVCLSLCLGTFGQLIDSLLVCL